ncbi:MAG: beta-phosphoglucomutase family hydrolase [Candidatus Omnitrophica bacterium]|nr:beta-phosphoglucomutase family hydrolase [Candidatus Omnitrophota bacterium]
MNSENNNLAFKGAIFDLDGVITKTAVVHASAWKVMFDEYLQRVAQREQVPFKAFTYEQDYLTYVDGKPRYKGVQSFLESREIFLDWGAPSDHPDQETVCGLGNRKNIKFQDVLERDGIDVYTSTVRFIDELKARFIHVGVASSSKNCEYILKSAELEDRFETRVDGVISVELGLKGKPAGDIFIRAAQNMGVKPAEAIVIEDAVSGVQAGVNGKFGLVIGVAREGNEEDLKKNGADIVIPDFAEYSVDQVQQWFKEKNSI